MDYLTMKEAAKQWGITSRMVTYYCTSGKISGAVKKGDIWLIPFDTKKPIDGRTIAARERKTKGGSNNA